MTRIVAAFGIHRGIERATDRDRVIAVVPPSIAIITIDKRGSWSH